MTRPRGKGRELRQSALETYLRDISQTPLLTPEEEKTLAYRIGDGDVEARDLMVRANLRLVVSIARTFTGQGLSLQDLIEEGNLGLLRATEGFDPSMNTRFSTYASYWIRQSMKRALVNTGKMIRIPSYMVELLNKWRRTAARLHDELGRTPTPEEIGRLLGLPKKQMAIIKRAIRVCTVTPQTDHEEDGWSMDERILDSRTKTPELQLGEAEDRQRVLDLLDRLDQREATVLRMRYGLEDDAPTTLQEIGERLGLTRERVRQIESEALRKLSERLQARRA
jgi:RNA polymerase primary sigma factor